MSQRRRRPRNGSFHQDSQRLKIRVLWIYLRLFKLADGGATEYIQSNLPPQPGPRITSTAFASTSGDKDARFGAPWAWQPWADPVRSLSYDKPFSASLSVLIACKGDQDVARNEKIVAGFGDDEGSGRKSVCGIGWKSGGFGLWDFRERQNWPLRRSHYAPCTASGAGALHAEAVRLMLPASRGMKMQIPAYRCMLAPPSETSMPVNG
jgi:hypothetical protein